MGYGVNRYFYFLIWYGFIGVRLEIENIVVESGVSCFL